MSILFENETIPDDASALGTDSTDLACEVCGVPLQYSGRGRKPKRCEEHKSGRSSASTGVSRGRATDKNVTSALAVMDNVYLLLDMGLGMFSDNAQALWKDRQATLQARNEALFTADPALTKRVNAFGAKGSTGAFIGAHAMALFPVAVVLNAEVSQRAAERRARVAAQRAAAAGAPTTNADGSTDFGPGAAYMP